MATECVASNGVEEKNDETQLNDNISNSSPDVEDADSNQASSVETTTTSSLSPQLPDSFTPFPSSEKNPNAKVSSPTQSPVNPIPLPTMIGSSKLLTVKALKDWSITTLKCTKQKVMERFGHGTKTVDSELELQIEVLRDTHSKYQVILRQVRALMANFANVVQSQRDLADTFSDLSQKMLELNPEFGCNAETQKTMYKSGEMLIDALEFFASNLATLCDKTIEDTLLTIKQYETARVEYDAFRSDFETQQLASKDPVKVEEAQHKFEVHREKFDRLRSDLSIKMKLLDENKVKVMRRQLVLLQDAIAVYLSGNHLLVGEAMTRFNISLAMSNADNSSWLESSD